MVLCCARHGVYDPPLRSGAPCLPLPPRCGGREFLSLADALARRFQHPFAGLIELDDARQVARYGLIRAAACLKPGCCTSAVFLKRRIQGALQHYLRDHGRLVRVSRREHEKGIHPLGHQSLSAMTVSRHEQAALAALREQLA